MDGLDVGITLGQMALTLGTFFLGPLALPRLFVPPALKFSLKSLKQGKPEKYSHPLLQMKADRLYDGARWKVDFEVGAKAKNQTAHDAQSKVDTLLALAYIHSIAQVETFYHN